MPDIKIVTEVAGRVCALPVTTGGNVGDGDEIAFVEAMKIVREKPEVVIASLMKHLRIQQDVARVACRSFANVWEEVPYVRTDSVQAILDFLPKEQVKEVTPEKYIDNSLVKELESSGFIKNLYRR